MRVIADLVCLTCKHVWLAPFPPPEGARCPRCHTARVDVKGGKARIEAAPLQ